MQVFLLLTCTVWRTCTLNPGVGSDHWPGDGVVQDGKSACTGRMMMSHRCASSVLAKQQGPLTATAQQRASTVIPCSLLQRRVCSRTIRQPIQNSLAASCSRDTVQHPLTRPAIVNPLLTAVLCMCQALLLTQAPCALAFERDSDTFDNVPGQLRSDGAAQVSLGSLLKGEKRKEVETCIRKCVPTCIRGGEGAPGLGPLSMRREVVVFKDGFRSRTYCLRECAEVCSLSINTPVAPPVGP